jgi:ABC-type histidine transport system ATPase subunit
MPPTLGKSQVSTVRKQMKLQVVLICKNSCCIDFQSQVISLLSELGASTSEINKAMPKNANPESRKRNITAVDLNSPISKKSKLQSGLKIKEENKITQMIDSSSLENIAEDLVARLNVRENVADLVMVSMAFLPEQMPVAFQNTYKPIAAAGTTQQIKSLAKILAMQLNEAGLLKLDEQTSAANQPTASSKLITIDDLDNEDDDMEDVEYLVDSKPKLTPIKVERNDSVEVGEPMDTKPSKLQTPSTPLIKPLANIQSLVSKKNFNKTFKLSEVTANSAPQFNTQSLEELLSKTYSRILNSES